MSAFGFNVDNVFGTARKGAKRKSKRKRDSMDSMMGESLGIDTFSLADPNIDALSLGSDFGSQIGSRALAARLRDAVDAVEDAVGVEHEGGIEAGGQGDRRGLRAIRVERQRSAHAVVEPGDGR